MKIKSCLLLPMLVMLAFISAAQSGYVGINTSSPQSPFHVKRLTGSGGPYFNFAMATFESSDQSYLHLSHPNASETGILSGNQSTIIRSGLVFGVDSSMLFRTGGNVTHMKLSPSGYLGINTTSPRSLLHIRRSGLTTGPIHSLSYALFESNTNGYLQFTNTSGTEAGILSGNDATSIRSALIFKADSSVILRSGGNIDRLSIRPSGYVGVNMPSPQRMFHIRESAASGAILHEDAVAVIEKNDAAFVQVISSSSGISGFCASDPSSTLRGSLEFFPDLSVQLKTGGNLGLSIDSNGDVGIGTDNPQAQLDVSGSFKLGGSGSVFSGMYKVTLSHDIPSMEAGGSYLATFVHGPASTGATAQISPGFDLPDGLIIAYARCINGSVLVKFTNVSPSSINPPSYPFHITIIK